MFVIEIAVIPVAGWRQLAKDVEAGVELWKFADFCPAPEL